MPFRAQPHTLLRSSRVKSVEFTDVVRGSSRYAGAISLGVPGMDDEVEAPMDGLEAEDDADGDDLGDGAYTRLNGTCTCVDVGLR